MGAAKPSVHQLFTRIKGVACTLAAWLLLRRGAFDLEGRWHRFARWKEARLAVLCTALGEPWTRADVSFLGRRYQPDFVLTARRVAVEVRSAHELAKVSIERAMAFRAEGLGVRIVHSAGDLLALLRE